MYQQQLHFLFSQLKDKNMKGNSFYLRDVFGDCQTNLNCAAMETPENQTRTEQVIFQNRLHCGSEQYRRDYFPERNNREMNIWRHKRVPKDGEKPKPGIAWQGYEKANCCK